jgi:hypothetical protein
MFYRPARKPGCGQISGLIAGKADDGQPVQEVDVHSRDVPAGEILQVADPAAQAMHIGRAFLERRGGRG